MNQHIRDLYASVLAGNVEAAPMLADELEEQGHVKEAHEARYWQPDEYRDSLRSVGDLLTMEQLRGYDWSEAFGYAGEKATCAGNGLHPERALPNDLDTSVEPFGRHHVKRVIALAEGENDGDNWLVVGELHDGRFFVLDAGCDYTGWD